MPQFWHRALELLVLWSVFFTLLFVYFSEEGSFILLINKGHLQDKAHHEVGNNEFISLPDDAPSTSTLILDYFYQEVDFEIDYLTPVKEPSVPIQLDISDPVENTEIDILSSLQHILNDDYDTHINNYIQIAPDIYRVEETMIIEDQKPLVDCPANIHGYNSSSPSFHCVHFNDTAFYEEKPARTLWFDDYCAPLIDVNINTKEVTRTSRTRCTLYKFSPEENQKIQDYLAGTFRYDDLNWRITNQNPEEWLCVPNIFLLSQPKVGSTTIFDVLVAHPSIYRTSEYFKEPSFFSHPGIKSGIQSFDFIHYLQTQCSEEQILTKEMKSEAIARAKETGSVPTVCSPIQCGDYSTHYTHRTNVMHNLSSLQKVFPDARTITVMREPLAKQISGMNMNMRSKTPKESNEMAAKGIRQIHRRACASIRNMQNKPYTELCDGGNTEPAINADLFPYNDFELIEQLLLADVGDFAASFMDEGAYFGQGLYWASLRMIHEKFPRKNNFLAFAELFFSDSEARSLAIRDVFAFLGVDPLFVSPLAHSNPSREGGFMMDDLDQELKKGFIEILAVHTQYLMEQYQISRNEFPENWHYLLDL